MNESTRTAMARMTAIAGLAACFAVLVAAVVAAPLVRADDHAVAIRDTGFDPATLTVQPGDTVTWTNGSSQPVEIITDDGPLSDGQVAPGATFTHTFTTTGTVTYYVGGNPRLRATVVVEDPAAAGASPLFMIGVVVLAVVAVGAAIVTLIGAAGRQRPSPSP
ncbi:MAG TPA: hypothetical protein VGM28_03470 [Candidatus Limnocylindrales bacterium]|jgi:plastocyanin